jgi:hypothetical protein
MDDTKRGVATSLVIGAGALGAIFVVGNLAHLPPVSYAFGILALLAGSFLVFLAFWIGNRTVPRGVDVLHGFSHIANGIIGICLAAWLWTGFSGVLVAVSALALAVLSVLSLAVGTRLVAQQLPR